MSRAHPELVRLGVFGSYGRGDAAFGSDLDLIAIVAGSADAFLERGRSWPTEQLPVPAELLVYTEAEWRELERSGGRFAREVAADVLWLELDGQLSDLSP